MNIKVSLWKRLCSVKFVWAYNKCYTLRCSCGAKEARIFNTTLFFSSKVFLKLSMLSVLKCRLSTKVGPLSSPQPKKTRPSTPCARGRTLQATTRGCVQSTAATPYCTKWNTRWERGSEHTARGTKKENTLERDTVSGEKDVNPLEMRKGSEQVRHGPVSNSIRKLTHCKEGSVGGAGKWTR